MSSNDILRQAINALQELTLDVPTESPSYDEETTALRQAMASLELARKLVRKAYPPRPVTTAEAKLDKHVTFTEVVTDTVTGESFVNDYNAKGWLVSSKPVKQPKRPEEGVDRCACGAKYWDNASTTGFVCHSCGEPWSGVSA